MAGTHRSACVCLCCLGVLLLGGGPASAKRRARKSALEDGAPELAVKRYEVGRRLYAKGKLKGAAREFEAALELFPDSPKLHYNLARTLERLDRLEEATGAYGRYLELAPRARDRAEVERLVESLKERLVEQQPRLVLSTEPAGARVLLDDAEEPLDKQTPMRTRVAPGAHVLRFQLPGYREASRPLTVERGDVRALHVTLVRWETVDQAAQLRSWTGVSLVVVAAGALGVGLWALGESGAAEDQALRKPEDQDAVDRYESMYNAGMGLVAGGGVALLAGGGLLIWNAALGAPFFGGASAVPLEVGPAAPGPGEPAEEPEEEEDAPPPGPEEDPWSLAPVPHPGGAVLTWSLRF